MQKNKAVLITGTSTGIGKACALQLDKLGFKVYAGVRKKADADVLKIEASDRLTPVILDVTDPESICSAVHFVWGFTASPVPPPPAGGPNAPTARGPAARRAESPPPGSPPHRRSDRNGRP